jgi:hypothetical protein
MEDNAGKNEQSAPVPDPPETAAGTPHEKRRMDPAKLAAFIEHARTKHKIGFSARFVLCGWASFGLFRLASGMGDEWPAVLTDAPGYISLIMFIVAAYLGARSFFDKVANKILAVLVFLCAVGGFAAATLIK